MANSADADQLASSIWTYTVCKHRTYPGSAELGSTFRLNAGMKSWFSLPSNRDINSCHDIITKRRDYIISSSFYVHILTGKLALVSQWPCFTLWACLIIMSHSCPKLYTGMWDRTVDITHGIIPIIYLFVLQLYCLVNPMGSCRAWSVYLTQLLLGRLSPLSG